MDYEQKYNKLVNAIKVLQETNPSDEGIQNWVNDNVPELRESEDERIRKYLIYCVNRTIPESDDFNEISKEQILAWLEKQKPEVNVVKFKPGVENEQKPVEWEQDNTEDLTDFEKAFQGMCCDKNKQFAKECCKTLLELAKKQLQPKWDKQCCGEVNDFAMQQQLQIWFDKGKCSGRDEVIFHPEIYGLQRQGEQKPVEWKQENVGELSDFENAMMHIGRSFFGENAGLDPNDTAAIKEQARLLTGLVVNIEEDVPEQNLSNEVGNYDHSKVFQSLYNKPTSWSEEDDKIWKSIIDDTVQENQLDNKQINWLIYLKQRYTWKPSKGQMEALKNACDKSWEPDGLDPLYMLYEDLEKLKGEKL